jgi:hypothetical protein
VNTLRLLRPLRPARHGVCLLAGACLLLTAPLRASAQDGFLFSPPSGGLTLRAGPQLYTAGGDLFGQLRRDLTLGRGDFAATAVGADLVFSPLPRVDLVVGAAHARASGRSEFRDFVDQDELPIEQTTSLRTTPLTGTVRYLLLSRGRSVGRTAWVPAPTTPYLGAGGGVTWYRLEHGGEFIDFRDYSIYFDRMQSAGSVPTLHVLAGLDHWFEPRLGVNVEARYTWGRAAPADGFRSFDALDVGGVQATLGLSFRW